MQVFKNRPQNKAKNILINADFRINQRGYVSGTATSGANEYTLDRWRIVTLGESITFPALGTDNEITCPNGGLEQEVEALNVQGGDYVISWEGSAVCTVNGVSRVKGESFTLTGNTNATVRFSNGTVKEPQLEKGSVATFFDYRSIAEELALCLRYFYKHSNLITVPPIFNSTTNLIRRVTFQFPVKMRDIPSASIITHTNFSAAPSAVNISRYNINFQGTASAAGNGTQINSFIADAEL
jgi:hypothetical protein